MDWINFFQKSVQVIGIGGFSLFLFLLLTKGVLKKVPPPKSMDRERYSKIINRVLLYTFLTALTGLVLYGVLAINKRTNEALVKSNKAVYELNSLKTKYENLDSTYSSVSSRLKNVEESNLKILTSGVEQVEKTVMFDLTDWKSVSADEIDKKIAKVKTNTKRVLSRTSKEATKFYATYATSSQLTPKFYSKSNHKLTPLLNDDRLPMNKPNLKRWLLDFDISKEKLFNDFILENEIISWNSFQNPTREFCETLILSPCKKAEVKVRFPQKKLPIEKSLEFSYRTLGQGRTLQPIENPTFSWDSDNLLLTWEIDNPRLGKHYRITWNW